MPRIEIRDVPADVYATYERRAAAKGQSLEEYLLAELSRNASLRTVEEWLEAVDAWRTAHPEAILGEGESISDFVDFDAERDIDRRRREYPH